MPVYLVHGFRWPREGFSGIRVHAIIHNLEDTSVDYIQNENSKADILGSFRKLFPDIMKELEGPGRNLEFIEQYNPEDDEGPNCVSQPYAYVGDKVVTIAANPGAAVPLAVAGAAGTAGIGAGSTTTDPPKTAGGASQKKPRTATLDVTALSVNVEEVISDGPGLTNRAWEALADLRDKIASGEKIGWWVVYNGDPERGVDDEEDYDDDFDYEMDDVKEEEDEEIESAQQQQRSLLQQQQQQQISPAKSQTQTPSKPITSPTTTLRPRTAPTSANDNNNASTFIARHPQVPTSPVEHISSQQQRQQSDLTALPVRTTGTQQPLYPPPQPAEVTSPARSDKGKGKGKQRQEGDGRETIPTPKVKEAAKTQGLRKKFFGKRL